MAEQQVVVTGVRDLTPYQRARAAALPDFLERADDDPGRTVDDVYESAYVAFVGEEPVGRISVCRRRLLPYRDPGTGAAGLLDAGLIGFPVTPGIAPDVWRALVDTALAELFAVGTDLAAVYLPPECRRHADFLGELGFKRYADAERPTPAEAFAVPCTLYVRQATAHRGYRRPDVYPISTAVNLLPTANASTALRPESGPWAAVGNYSGFSGYAWLTGLLDGLLGAPRRLLSIPAGTGDAVRLLPARVLATLHSAVGVDILDRNVAFARARLDYPYLDVLNMTLCTAFLEAQATADAQPVLELLCDVCARAGRPLSADDARELYVALRAVTAEALACGGIADWFAPTKCVGRFVADPAQADLAGPGLDECVALVDRLGDEAVRALVATHGHRPAQPHQLGVLDQLRDRAADGALTFETADMFTYTGAEPFDTIFVWEALLIVAGAGRERDFVDMVDRNLAGGGTAVMTGIRRADGRWGRDLEIVRDEFAARGYATTLTVSRPAADRWARGFLPRPEFPVLLAVRPV